MSDRRPTDTDLEAIAADLDGIGGAVPVMARELLELRGVARDRRDEIVCLQAELEAKRAQHAETLRLLEHAYEVTEAQNRPPLGYVVLERRPLTYSGYRYSSAGEVEPDGEGIAAYMTYRLKNYPLADAEYVIAELREVQP